MGQRQGLIRAALSALLLLGVAACGTSDGDANDASGLPDWWGANDTREPDTTPDVADTPDPDDTRDEPAPELAEDGEPCDGDDACESTLCQQGDDWPGGYCTERPCDDDDDCSTRAAICTSHASESLCARTCDSDDECREGYGCERAVGRLESVCVPVDEVVVRDGAVDGAPCTEDDECAGGTCLEDWPGGYCTTRDCNTYVDCARGEGGDAFDNRCLIQDPINTCVRLCDTQDDCRADEGYICQSLGGGQGMCAPAAAPDWVAEDINFDDSPFDVTCGLAAEDGRVTITYDVADTTSAYMIVPITLDGLVVEPEHVVLPDGERIDFDGENGFQLAPSILFGFANPFVVPATPAFADQLQAGQHELVIATRSEDLCWYMVEESEPGTVIDVNVYLVGVPGVTAETAPDNPNFAEVFETFDTIFSGAGVSLGELRYFDPPDRVIELFSIIRSDTDVLRMVTATELPGETIDDALSLNVFFVRGFAFAGGSGVIGISMGLPGAAGAHGTPLSGVAFTSEFMGITIPGEGDGDAYTGVVLAHEVGHYLGLFHTTEQASAGFDPLTDTAECRSGFPGSCPDLNNLMFPLAGSSHTQLTAEQGFVVGANPLTKP